jgi:copper chaperone CopZ
MATVETRPKNASLATLGAVLTAIIGSACCWLPLLLIAFGFSAAGVSSVFEAYRPFFLTAAFLLLAFAWYLTYRPAIKRGWMRLTGKEAKPSAEACCARESPPASSQSCCPPASSRRLWLNQVMLWVATVVVIAFAFFPSNAGIFLGGGNPQTTTETTAPVVTLSIEGMTCEACTVHFQKALAAVPGVQSATVDYSKATARVAVDAKTPPSREALVKAVESVGYKAHADLGEGR